MKRRTTRRAFTLIEVLAALGLIIVLTLTLVVTIRAQVEQANRQQLRATVETVNAQIDVAYQQPDRIQLQFNTLQSLIDNGIITAQQAQLLAGKATYQPGTQPPAFKLTP
ncbi:type II secretion system protein [Lacticaseibacillus absianus]|uniref:type II secretion system protein n=1 Tax=Lacticaseibacillus absianus TaxID=2729623 RepID=UPI001FE99357|nr:type II secretion system protein [Lacticaseibacillus absianus]